MKTISDCTQHFQLNKLAEINGEKTAVIERPKQLKSNALFDLPKQSHSNQTNCFHKPVSISLALPYDAELSESNCWSISSGANLTSSIFGAFRLVLQVDAAAPIVDHAPLTIDIDRHDVDAIAAETLIFAITFESQMFYLQNPLFTRSTN